MVAADDRAYDTVLLDVSSRRVMVGDAATGTQLQPVELALDDFNNPGGCNDRNISKRGRTRSRRNTYDCNLVNLRDLAKRFGHELGVQTSTG